MIRHNTYERYQRQIILKEFGPAAQDKLLAAKVLVVGAGGLGCPALQYLAAAGVGSIGIIDFDLVELSNLQRQTLFTVEDIGKPKAIVATQKLKLLNPDIQIDAYYYKITHKNAWDLLGLYDIILDSSDNFATRYLLNDACVLLNKPLVYGAVLRFEGQVAVFNLQTEQCNYKTNYRDLFPQPPLPHTVPSCNEAGVIGVLPGIIGTMQAAEVIKIITAIGEPLTNKLLTYNVRNNRFFEFLISPAKSVSINIPANKTGFENFNYEWHCGIANTQDEITVDEFDELRRKDGVLVMDVREIGELPAIDEFPFIQIPLSKLEQRINEICTNKKIVVFCQSGIRSLKAVTIIRAKTGLEQVYSLKAGIESWKIHNRKKAIF